jgi:hypothetical protein
VAALCKSDPCYEGFLLCANHNLAMKVFKVLGC